MVRALALRTMGCIRIERILDYLVEPIRRGVKDASPYVRKTAALCIAKVFDLSAEVGEEGGFLEMLQELLMSDSNPMVVSNVIAALSDIQSLCPTLAALKLDKAIVQRLLAVLNDCTEWGQVFILDALATYSTDELEEAEKIVETVLPRLQHANQAIVLSAVNVLLRHGLLSTTLPLNHHFRVVLERKLSAPLISMLTAPPNSPEIQYAALRNVMLILKEQPKLFGTDIKVFFCSYNDPQFVKLEKLEAIGLLVDDNTIDRILPELLEYAKDVDEQIARKSIKILAQCALNVPRWSSRISEVFAELLQTAERPEIVQQLTASLVPLMRNEACADAFFSLLKGFYFEDLLVASEALQGGVEGQCAFAWLLGAFLNEHTLGLEAEQVSAGLEVFKNLLERFDLEPVELQEQLVLAALKMFLLNGKSSDLKEQAMNVLDLGIKAGESVDFQDRCRVFKLLLEREATQIVAAVKPQASEFDPFSTFSDSTAFSAPSTTVNSNISPLEQLLLPQQAQEEHYEEESLEPVARSLPYHLGSVASIVHLPPAEFVSAQQVFLNADSLKASASLASLPEAFSRLLRTERPAVTNLLEIEVVAASKTPKQTTSQPETTITNVSEKYANLLDLLD